MKKGILPVMLLLTASAMQVHALDLFLRDGTRLNNVTIINTSDYGIQINADQYGNGEDIITRTIRWGRLTPQSYEAAIRTSGRDSFINAMPVPAPGTPIQFNSVTMKMYGTIGWAMLNAPDLPADPTNFGKIYIYGLLMPQSGTWFGRIYPANKVMYHRGVAIPVFTMDPESPAKLSVIGLSGW